MSKNSFLKENVEASAKNSERSLDKENSRSELSGNYKWLSTKIKQKKNDTIDSTFCFRALECISCAKEPNNRNVTRRQEHQNSHSYQRQNATFKCDSDWREFTTQNLLLNFLTTLK